MLRAALAVAIGLATASAYAQVFKCTDPSGKVEYRNSACPAGTQSAQITTPVEKGRVLEIQRSEEASTSRREDAEKQDAIDARASARPLRRSAPVNSLPPPPEK